MTTTTNLVAERKKAVKNIIDAAKETKMFYDKWDAYVLFKQRIYELKLNISDYDSAIIQLCNVLDL